MYRPRVVVHGPSGMGQGYVGAAVLHHLEGYHVQSLELGNLMGDSTRVSTLCYFMGYRIDIRLLDDRGGDRAAVRGGETEPAGGDLHPWAGGMVRCST